MVRFPVVMVALAVLFTLNRPPAAAATTFGTVSPDNTSALYAFTRSGAQLTGFSDPAPIPGLKITLPAGSQNGPKFALITLNMPTVSLTCDCSATGAFYLAVGNDRFASGETSVYFVTTPVFSPMTIVAAIPLTFSQQVVVGKWGLAASGSMLNLGPWASLSAVLVTSLTP
jgi:hypothetical protein